MPAVLERLHERHQGFRAGVEGIKTTADLIELAPVEAVIEELEEDRQFLMRDLLPHAEAEEDALYRAYDQLADTTWATDMMRRDHREIVHLAQELVGLRLQLFTDPLTVEQKHELRRVLYGLYAILNLHFAKEEEILLPRLEQGLTQEAADRLIESMEAATEIKRAKTV